MKFFPFVLSLFMFILMSNVVGIIPYTFTVTSHIIITVALALTVFLTVVIYGLWKNGLHFFNLFLPSGIPKGCIAQAMRRQEVFVRVFSQRSGFEQPAGAHSPGSSRECVYREEARQLPPQASSDR